MGVIECECTVGPGETVHPIGDIERTTFLFPVTCPLEYDLDKLHVPPPRVAVLVEGGIVEVIHWEAERTDVAPVAPELGKSDDPLPPFGECPVFPGELAGFTPAEEEVRAQAVQRLGPRAESHAEGARVLVFKQ